MPTSTTTSDTRARLVEAAKTLLHRQGVSRTTLAEIAQAAGVPLGNIYYHFKTKEALVAAVIEAHQRGLEARFARWERDPDPRARLRALLADGRDSGETLARFGCPHGSLCQELDKDDSPLTQAAAGLFRRYLDWTASQFRLLGTGDEADALALDLISSLQGAYLLTNTFRSHAVLASRLDRLERWLDTL